MEKEIQKRDLGIVPKKKSSDSELEGEEDDVGGFHLTEGEEDYLKSIDIISGEEEEVTISKLADYLGHKAPSVTEMVDRLNKKNLVDHEKYGGISLTEKGRRLAKEVETRHETLANFLELFGVEEERAELDACKMEHFIKDETIDKLQNFLEFVENSPEEPLWLEHFRVYLEKEEHPECEYR